MFEEFIQDLESLVKKKGEFRTVFFHNFARFDGLFIIKYYAQRAKTYYAL